MLRKLLWVLMLVYSVALLAIEWTTSQAHVRHYFTDITGPVFFYAANTSLCVMLLAMSAVLAAFCALVLDSKGRRSERVFDASQTIVFAGLAFDDRFGLHEAIGSRLPFDDAVLLGLVGVVEILLLVRFRDAIPSACRRWILIAGAFFGAMLIVDAFAPLEARLRLSAEDLLKAWGALFVLVFAWEIARARAALGEAARSKA